MIVSKMIVRNLQNVHVVSDGGAISEALGFDATEWQLVAHTVDEIGGCVERLERLLVVARARGMDVEIEHPISYHNPATMPREDDKQADDLDTLALSPHQLSRLRKALAHHGITSVARLAGCTREFLLAQEGIGVGTVQAIKRALHAQGVRLATKVGKTGE